jgi:hypothetical protein
VPLGAGARHRRGRAAVPHRVLSTPYVAARAVVACWALQGFIGTYKCVITGCILVLVNSLK